MADLDPSRGREQSGTRPILVVSVDQLNHGPRDLVIILPMTGTPRNLPSHVPVNPPEGGLLKPSLIMTEQIRAISKDRLVRPLGSVTSQTMNQVENLIRLLLNL
jgi:mRNA interferase MazF